MCIFNYSTLSSFLILKYQKEYIKKMKQISEKHSAQMASVNQHRGLKIKEIVRHSPVTVKLLYTGITKGILVHQVLWISVDLTFMTERRSLSYFCMIGTSVMKELIGGEHPKLQKRTDV